MKIKLGVAILLAVTLLSSTVSCGKGTNTDNSVSDLHINTTSLPAWLEGTAASVTLEATGGTGKKTWTGTPPTPWTLSSSGVISGIAPMLGSGTSIRQYPPFTATVTDEAKHSKQVSLTITVIRKGPELTPKTATLLWDKGNPPVTGSLYIATASGGEPPYQYWSASGGGFPPFGMSVEIGADGVSFYLKGPPTAKAGTYNFKMSIIDSNRIEATCDVTVQIKEAVNEVFIGTFSGPLGITSGGGAQYSNSISGTITLTLVHNDDGTITGTAEVSADVGMVVIQAPPDMDVSASPFSVYADGTVSETGANLNGTFTSSDERPLKIVFTGVRSSNTITCSLVVSKTFHTWWDYSNGVSGEVYTPLSTTISNVVLTKQQ